MPRVKSLENQNIKTVKVEKGSRLVDVILENNICISNMVIIRIIQHKEVFINDVLVTDWKYLVKNNCMLKFAKHDLVRIEVY